MLSTRKEYIILFILSNLVTLLFALYTDHRWEDWYITFKASKNLALGNGLVYTIGERVHTFTSPIGTLIPAFLSYISGNKNDEFVIWSFRVISSISLSLSGLILFRLTQKLNFSKILSYLLLAAIFTHLLIVDFSINGMETAFMLLFLSMFISLMIVEEKNHLIKLALVMAALMYTRPDSFVYFGSIALGFFIFNPKTSFSKTRIDFVLTLLKAGAISIAIYLPWIVFTSIYYGSPIPHTITAKALTNNYSALYLLIELIKTPYYIAWGYSTLVSSVFSPPYWFLSDWPNVHVFSKTLAFVPALYFLLPKGSKNARAISFGICLMIFYLLKISGQGAMPWYLPNVALPIIVVFFIIIHHHYNSLRLNLYGLSAVLITFNIFILFTGAKSLKAQQNIVEFGNRKQIGLWLKEHSQKNESVFLECLGYIGYYSELKTYDFPGMSSPEVVQSRKKLNTDDYAALINDLNPDWLVLRPSEAFDIETQDQDMFTKKYYLAKRFDVSDSIPKILGDGYIKCDAVFNVYRKLN
jgi:hypothetical protein